MLSRTASELFWMARYLERAESYARVLDVTWKLSMIPRHSQQSRDLALPLNLSMTHELFQARHARFTMSNLLNFFALDGNNPCSIYSCVEMAWNNAHAVRGSLSAEVWESINATRIELRTLRQQGLGELGSDGFFEWVKERVHLLPVAVNAQVELPSLEGMDTTAVKTVLAGKPTDKQTRPVSGTMEVSEKFGYELPAYSFTVIRINKNKNNNR